MQSTQTTVSLAFLLQLYAPLAGLLVVVFWLGVLSQRVKVTERRQDRTDEKLDAAMIEATQVAVLNDQMSGVRRTLEKMEREMQGVQRALANIASRTANPVVTFDQEPH